MLSWLAQEWLGVTLDYVAAALIVALGLVLAFGLDFASDAAWIPALGKKIIKALLKPLRVIGCALIALGLVKGAVAYGKSIGAADCRAAAQAAALERQVNELTRDVNAWKAAAEFKDRELTRLAQQKEASDAQIADWKDKVGTLSKSVARCRRATADDDRRLCQLIGNAAAGCKPAH